MNALKLLQKNAGVDDDGIFGRNTFNAAKDYLQLPSDWAAVHFFAQCAHETGMFKRFTENLNYSAQGLRNTWPHRFDAETAQRYHRQPERIANRAYANRIGNGDEESGDGWKFRGRGALQLTGRANYQSFSVYVDDHTIMQNPDLVAGKYAFQTAIHFFEKRGLWELCRQGLNEQVVRDITRIINGGQNGIEHRIELTNKYAGYI